ncbi:MAG: hypothetical protein Q7S33_02250 [Nanoarchaeota archaeon]|nr:hypothetical protein [Nanoarchaeota archaeon]
MKTVLYVDKELSIEEAMRFRLRGDTRLLDDIRNRRNLISNAITKDFNIDLSSNLRESTMDLIADKIKYSKPYEGLVSHFPYDKDFLDSDEVKSMESNAIRKRIYQPSFDLIKKIRDLDSDLIMVAYTGCSSGESADPSSSTMNQMLRDAGFNDLVYKSQDSYRDSLLISEKLIRLLQ